MPRNLPAFFYFLDLLLLCVGGEWWRGLSLWNMVGGGCIEPGQKRQGLSAPLDRDSGPVSQEDGLEALEKLACGWLRCLEIWSVLVDVSKLADL